MTAQKQVGRSQIPKKTAPKQSAKRWSLLNDAIDHLGWVPDGEHRVFMVLYRFANESREAWPGQTLIARRCRCSQGEVSRRLKWLLEHGLLELVRRGHMGSRTAGVYRIQQPHSWPSAPPDGPPD